GTLERLRRDVEYESGVAAVERTQRVLRTGGDMCHELLVARYRSRGHGSQDAHRVPYYERVDGGPRVGATRGRRDRATARRTPARTRRNADVRAARRAPTDPRRPPGEMPCRGTAPRRSGSRG